MKRKRKEDLVVSGGGDDDDDDDDDIDDDNDDSDAGDGSGSTGRVRRREGGADDIDADDDGEEEEEDDGRVEGTRHGTPRRGSGRRRAKRYRVDETLSLDIDGGDGASLDDALERLEADRQETLERLQRSAAVIGHLISEQQRVYSKVDKTLVLVDVRHSSLTL